MQFQIKCVKGQNKKHQPIRFNVELKVASIDETKNQQQKTLFPLNLWSSWIGQESMLVWHLERNIAFKINKDDASSAWNSSISHKICFEALSTNFWTKIHA